MRANSAPRRSASSASPPADNRGKRIGILIVAYNAVTTLADVLRRIPDAVWKNVEEVVVFDDASKDDTYELAVGYKTLSRLENLTVIKNEKNLGYGGNQKLGYRYFMDKGFDIVVLLHGDGQYAPEVLSHLYAPIVADEADAVFGSRMMKTYGGALQGGMPLYKYVGNQILSHLENRTLNMSLTEFHSGYRAYSLAALRQINLTKMTNDFHFDTEIIVKLNHQRFRIKEVPIPTYYGDEICYVNGMNYAADVVRSVVRYSRTTAGLARYPEYAEYFPHYPIKESQYSSHYWFLQLVGRDKDVLDIGCGEGFFAQKLSERGNRVVGVDVLPEPRIASTFQDYVSLDLETEVRELRERVAGRRFDYVLLQDVLEHLRRPEELLRECRDLLKPQGVILVSLPNIANVTVRLSLLLGRFEYAERGILDQGHVRFYTRKTARRFLEANGYDIIQDKMSVMPIEVALGLSARNPLMKAANRAAAGLTTVLPGVFGYQSILMARPRAGANVPEPGRANGRHARSDADALRRRAESVA